MLSTTFVPYSHVVFTVPHLLAPLALQNKKLIYTLLLRLSAETLIEVARHPKHLGAEIGFFSVLHSWTQKIEYHPHVHCVVPAGGLSFNHRRWVSVNPRYRFFLPRKVLGLVFQGKLTEALKQAFADHQITLRGKLRHLSDTKAFHSFVRQMFRHNWVVHCKRPFGGPEQVLRYLGRYTHRVAISHHRLVSFANGEVTFRWRDRAHGNREQLLTLQAEEFLRRFMLHLLPKGFVRIRSFGYLANRKRATLLPLCFQHLRAAPDPSFAQAQAQQSPSCGLWKCPQCGGPMMVVLWISAPTPFPRSPPTEPMRGQNVTWQL